MEEKLSDIDLDRYARQIVLADIGYDGQLALRRATVCLVGLGGLGSQLAPRMVGMGIGSLRMVDRDIVSRSDLHRQTLYDVDWVGRPKVEAAFEKLRRLNPDVALTPLAASLNPSNATAIIQDADVVVDGLDTPEARYIVNRVCRQHGIPYVFGAAIEAFGSVSTLVPGESMCLECFMPGFKNEDLPKCGVVGVHPAVLGVVTGVQTAEAVRLILGKKPLLVNRLLQIDLREMAFDTIDLKPRDSCTVCGSQPVETDDTPPPRWIEETCARDGKRNIVISPKENIQIQLERLRGVLSQSGHEIKTAGSFGVTFENSEGITFCMLHSGTLIVQIPPDRETVQTKDLVAWYAFVLVEKMGFSPSLIPET
jgi:adenylyltransferase/sulfurtransferase